MSLDVLEVALKGDKYISFRHLLGWMLKSFHNGMKSKM